MGNARPKVLGLGTAVITAVATLLLVSGCADDPQEEVGASGSSGAIASDNNDGTEAQPEEEADPFENMSPSECLVGTWLADNELFLSHMKEFGDEIQTVGGDVFVTLSDDGGMTTDYQNWEITGVVEGMAVTIHRAGVDTGVFTANDSTVTLEDREMGATVRLTGQGVDMTVPAEAQIQSDVPYTCDATEVVMDAEQGTHRMVRQ